MSSNGYASKEQLLGQVHRRYRDLQVGDLRLRIQSISEGENAEIQAAILDPRTGRPSRDGICKMRPLMIAKCLVDADGNRIFTDDDIGAIRNLDSRVAEAVYEACQEHCDLEEVPLEKLAKN